MEEKSRLKNFCLVTGETCDVIWNCTEFLMGAEFVRKRMGLVTKEKKKKILRERTATSKKLIIISHCRNML